MHFRHAMFSTEEATTLITVTSVDGGELDMTCDALLLTLFHIILFFSRCRTTCACCYVHVEDVVHVLHTVVFDLHVAYRTFECQTIVKLANTTLMGGDMCLTEDALTFGTGVRHEVLRLAPVEHALLAYS